jgi:hypothetical protein
MRMWNRIIRIGAGAGYAGDRLDPAIELAANGDLQYICFECLAERTIALAQQEKMKDPSCGYGQFLEERMEAMLPYCAAQGLVMISNLGAANPVAAYHKTIDIARALPAGPLKIGAVTGDDVMEYVVDSDVIIWETGSPVSRLDKPVVSANAYLGADAILPALEARCQVIITGRVADPSLFLAPMIHEFGWAPDDWQSLGKGTAAAHLLECAAQVTGGYFADPGLKDVPNLSHVGFPVAEIRDNGDAWITKLPGSGGLVSVETCKEQILYEVHDPARYITPDVTADFSHVTLTQDGQNRVAVGHASGHARPDTLKVSVGVEEGYIGEGEISFAGHGALARARQAAEIVAVRLKRWGLGAADLKIEYIGHSALLGSVHGPTDVSPPDVRVRVAAGTATRRLAQRVGEEVETLYLNGPAGAAGARKYVRPVIGIYSASVPRNAINLSLHITDVP